MRPRATRLVILAALSGVSALALCNLGCEKLESQSRQSERRVDQVAQEAVQKEQAERPQMYGRAASEAMGKSDAATARARQLQAEAEYNAGTALLQQANNQASVLGMGISDVNHLVTTIQTSNSLIAGYGHYDSRPIRREAEEQIARIKGSTDQEGWVAGPNAVPSLTQVKKIISELESQIAGKEAQVKKLSEERVEDLRHAEDLSEQADKAKGSAWVSVYKQASGLRKKAADISSQIDVINSEIEPLKVNLGIAQENQKIARAAIVGVEAQAKGAEESFAAVRAASGDHEAVVRRVYENQSNTTQSSAGPQSLKDKIDALVADVNKAQTTWDAAEKLLTDSADHFQAAQSAADSLQVKVEQRSVDLPSDSPRKQAWDQLKSVYNPTLYQYHRAVALQTLGTLCSDQLASLMQLSTMKKEIHATLKQAKLPVPASLEGLELASKIKQLRTTGQEAFSKADEAFQNVINAPLATADQRNSARAARVVELYAWYKFAQATHSPKAEAHLTMARDAIKDAMENNATLPLLPLEIQPHLASPSTAATSRPAVASTGPTTAPARR